MRYMCVNSDRSILPQSSCHSMRSLFHSAPRLPIVAKSTTRTKRRLTTASGQVITGASTSVGKGRINSSSGGSIEARRARMARLAAARCASTLT